MGSPVESNDRGSTIAACKTRSERRLTKECQEGSPPAKPEVFRGRLCTQEESVRMSVEGPEGTERGSATWTRWKNNSGARTREK